MWVILGLALASVWMMHVQGDGVWAEPSVAERIHQEVIDGTADYPHQYRPLVPLLCEAMTRGGVPLRLAYLLQRFSFLFLAALVLHEFLRGWLSEEVAFGGVIFFVALWPFSCLGQGFQETDPLNVLVFFVAYALLRSGRYLWLYPLVLVGMLNRETTALVVLLAAAVRIDEWRTARYWLLVGGLAAVAAGVYWGLHHYYGPREAFTELVTPRENVPANLSRVGSLRALVLFGPFWFLALTGLAAQPAFLRRSAVLVPVFLLVHLGYGLLGETRYFLPLAPTILGLGLRRLFPAAAREPAG